jgi:Holliday junction resolvase RusA-like endonuclease
MPEFVFKVNPIAASRPRISKWGAYYTGPYKKFKIDAAKTVVDTLGSGWVPLEENLRTEVFMYVTKPKRTKLDYPKADIDNYLKAIFDCLNGKLWVDDKQVVVVHATKAWTDPGEEGYFVMRVEEID